MNQSFNIEDVMTQIRKDISDTGPALDLPPFDAIPIHWGQKAGAGRGLLLRCKDRVLSFVYFKLYLRLPQGVKNIIRKLRRILAGGIR